jgi:hypothetical protein
MGFVHRLLVRERRVLRHRQRDDYRAGCR